MARRANARACLMDARDILGATRRLNQQLPATPAIPSSGAWDWLGEQIHGPASPAPAPHRAAQNDPPLELPATPATPSEGAWRWLGQQMQEPASPSSIRPRSSNIYAGLDAFVDLDPSTQYDLRDDAHSAPAAGLAAAPSFASSRRRLASYGISAQLLAPTGATASRRLQTC